MVNYSLGHKRSYDNDLITLILNYSQGIILWYAAFISDSEAQSQLFIGGLIFVGDVDLRLLDLKCSERRRVTQILYGELQIITWMYALNFTQPH